MKKLFFLKYIFVILTVFLFIQCAEDSVEKSRTDSKSKRFGATYMTLNNPFFSIIDSGIREVVEGKGDKLITTDPELKTAKQIVQIDDLIAQQVDGIFLNPVDWKKIKPALVAAKNAKIPVFVVDAPVYNAELTETLVASDNYNAGVLCAKHLLNKLKYKSGNIVLLTHPTAKSAIDRIIGFEKTIKKQPKFKIVARELSNGQLEQAIPAMEKVIKKTKNFNIVMCLNDPTALGAIGALENANLLSGKIIYGVDAAADAIEMIKKGKLTATVAQDPYKIGQVAAKAAYKFLSGEKIDKNIKIPVKLYDENNVKEFK